MRIPKPIKNLIEAFERLPGVGPKTAQRLTFYLLHVPQEELNMLSTAVSDLKANTSICSICKNVGETDPCEVCSDTERDRSIVAVVESPLDVLALERAGFKGLYHVLHGAISPLNNIGPDDLFIDDLIKRLKSGYGGVNGLGGINGSISKDPATSAREYLSSDVLTFGKSWSAIKEVILATNTNMEGESTSMYIAKLINNLNNVLSKEAGEIKVTRIARGLPVGGDIEYADDITLKRALDGRAAF